MDILAKTPNILVTGGTGFFGRELVKKILSEGYSVRIISRSKHHFNEPNLSMFYGDITRYEDVKEAMKGCSAIFHCAAEKNNCKNMRSVNVEGTELLLKVALDTGIKFFCHLSSVSVIGKTSFKIVDESTPCNPMNLYEETKLEAENVVKRYLGENRVVILRPTNIFGVDTVTGMMMGSLKTRLRLILKGNELAHLIYVKDVVAASFYLFKNFRPTNDNTYIVSCDEEVGNSHAEVQAYLATNFSDFRKPFFISFPIIIPYLMRLIKHGQTNCGDIIYSSRKLRDTGFVFPFGLKMGLADAVDYAKS